MYPHPGTTIKERKWYINKLEKKNLEVKKVLDT
jgi:hypothetical protein